MSTEINISSGSSGSVTSVDLTMPSAFNVSGNPITSAGTLAVTGAGSVSEYVRGDGSLASFPSTTGGGASVNYYLNGGTNQGTFSGSTYYQASRTAVVGSPTTFSTAVDGYIASFITDAGDPNKLLIPSGNWNCSLYFVASTNTGSPRFYVELYKYDGAAFTLIASSASNSKEITGGTTLDSYTTTLAVPQTVLTLTDRLAFRVYVVTSGNTITLNTQGDTLCQIVTTFTTGLTALNGLTDQVQFLTTGTSGTNFGISSVGNTHTLNLPTASAVNRGALSASDWTNFNSKLSNLTINSTPLLSGTAGRILFQNSSNQLSQSTNLFWDQTNNRLGIGISSPLYKLHIQDTINGQLRMQATNLSTGSLGETLFGAFMTGNRYAAARQFSAGATGTYIAGVNKQSLSLFESGNDSSAILISAANPTAFISFATATVEKARIDNVGNFLIGRNTAGTSATKSIVQANGTAPTSSPADSYQQYSADITTGNAAPHFRTENGSVVKLYQETTGVAAATLVSNVGTTLTSTDTFDGYTIQQVVKALRNLGILA